MLDRFRGIAAAAPGATALIDAASGEITSRETLAARGDALAARLHDAGLREGDLVAVRLPNSVNFVAAFIAALKLRLVFVPIDRDAPETEVAAILTHFGVRALVYKSNGSVAVSTRGVDVRWSGGQVVEHPTTRSPDHRTTALPPDARLLRLTSGSTGKPKGIATSEKNLIADCSQICATMGIRCDDINFGAIPFSHSYGFSNLVMPLLLQGTAVVMSNDYLPQSVVDNCNRHHCTVFPGIPMVFDHLVSAASGNFRTVRTFLSAGAPLLASTSRRFRERFGSAIHTFYGCSECGGITYDREGAAVERGTVGAALDGVSLSFNHTRLVIDSASVALGYLHDANTFQPFADGRFMADDLALLRDDGELALTGRASDLIITAGKKVNPREVEQIILQIDGVRQAKVYGEPAGARGEVVAAAIVANPDVTREQVRAFCRERLSLHKVPRIVKLIEQIPVDERGKVKRAALALL
jgi:long-chain acyl-CoA synthetase